jgi:hypothetical protein
VFISVPNSLPLVPTLCVGTSLVERRNEKIQPLTVVVPAVVIVVMVMIMAVVMPVIMVVVV